jgi:RNA polymerase sigma-70 factor (ECF subfamily)
MTRSPTPKRSAPKRSAPRDDAGAVESLRPLLFSIAYRMLASVGEAEDAVQEAFARYEAARREGVSVDSPKAYLSAVVTRLAIDQLRSARARRETYVGEWLPEPVVTDEATQDPADQVETAESLAMAFLLVLDRLNPVERAVFLLHDVFAYEYAEIAPIVGKTQTNARQIAARARRRVHAERPQLDPPGPAQEALASRFFAAVGEGDLDGLVSMLANDAAVYGDGGGKAPQWAAPIVGADTVARLFVGLGRQMAGYELHVEQRRLNGQPGAIVRDPQGSVVNVFVLDISGGRVTAVRSVINPDKLGHLGAVADARAIAQRARRQTQDA